MAQKRNTSGLLAGGMMRADNPALRTKSHVPHRPGIDAETTEGVDLTNASEWEKMRYWALRKPVRLVAEFDPD